MSRSAIEDAIATWVIGTCGLAADHVLWTDYEQPRPGTSYLALRLTNVRAIGQDWVFVTDNPDSVPDDGEEVISTVWGKRAATLTIQAINGGATGATSPAEVLETVRTKSRLPSVRAALNAAGVGIAEFGPVQTTSAALSASGFEPRAVLAVELNLMASVAEFGTYIETVEITNRITDPDTVYEVDL